MISPFKVHPPVHESVEVFGDEPVVEGRVVDGVNHRGNNELKKNRHLLMVKNLGSISRLETEPLAQA